MKSLTESREKGIRKSYNFSRLVGGRVAEKYCKRYHNERIYEMIKTAEPAVSQ